MPKHPPIGGGYDFFDWLTRRILTLKTLDTPGWDGLDGEAIDHGCADAVADGLSQMPNHVQNQLIRVWPAGFGQIIPMSGGTVQLEMHLPSYSLEIEFTSRVTCDILLADHAQPDKSIELTCFLTGENLARAFQWFFLKKKLVEKANKKEGR